ncbi:MAG: DUF1439 domain-containing protein [Pseudomonadota bacterium]
MALMLLALGALGWWFSERGVVSVSAERLQARLDERLPISQTVLYVVDVTIDDPRIDFSEADERVRATLSVELAAPLAGSYSGEVSISAAPVYARQTGELYLVEPRLERLAFDDLPLEMLARSEGVLVSALAEYLENEPVYRLPEGYAWLRPWLGEVRVHDGFVALHLDWLPARRSASRG